MCNNEVWQDVVGYVNLYEVSNLGRVRSLKCSNYRYLKQYLKNDGYVSVNLVKRRKFRKHNLDIIVAKAFIPNPNNYKMVKHKDNNKMNNCVDNLEWCEGVVSMRRKHKQVQQIDISTNEVINTFNSVIDAQHTTGCNQSNIIRCCKGKYKTTGGYKWSYIDG